MLTLQEAARGSCCFTNPASRVYIKTKQEGSRQLACLYWNGKLRATLWGKASQKLRLTTALSITSQTVVQSQSSWTPDPDLLPCLPWFSHGSHVCLLVQQLVKTPNLDSSHLRGHTILASYMSHESTGAHSEENEYSIFREKHPPHLLEVQKYSNCWMERTWI